MAAREPYNHPVIRLQYQGLYCFSRQIDTEGPAAVVSLSGREEGPMTKSQVGTALLALFFVLMLALALFSGPVPLA